MRSWSRCVIWGVALSSIIGCGEPGEEALSPDGEFDEGVTAGKADGSEFSDCELDRVLEWVNEAATTAQTLRDAGVHTRAANNIVDYRDNQDDNGIFDDVTELDEVRYVGPVAFQQLVAAVEDQCAGRANQVEVIFSPQEYEESHLIRVAEAIDAAALSVDIAIYSYSDARIREALERAIARGVRVRMIYESANGDHSDPEGTTSARLEEAGVDVRYVNKIMHHKFVIIDGPQSAIEQAGGATLITGSANWSNSAATRYDENTVIIRGNSELILRFQREFNHLWLNSRDLLWNEDLEFFTTLDITDSAILDDPFVDAVFTSANFRVYENARYGMTFSVIEGEDAVSDRLVELIMGAQESIHIASGHLRSRPVAEALIARHQQDPSLDVRVYLDNQEYLSEWSHEEQVSELEGCLAEAGDDLGDQQGCLDRGFLFSYQLHQEGVPVRFKLYCYRWHYTYAEQMHHKYMIIDGRTLVSGSYNLSDNAEHNTMENIVIYEAEAFPRLVAEFEANFEALWVTGEAEGLYEALMEEVVNGSGDTFPIVFEPMALDWGQVTELKSAIRDNCPDINSTDYRQYPQRHQYCER